MFFGVDYYPEHWEKDDWKKHIALMKEAHFNVVRIGEFAWGRLEPAENHFDFSWLDEAVDLFHKAGISVILGTPTAAPPKWLADKYDIYERDRYGRRRGFGSRRECCANHPDYIRRSQIITETLAEHYGNHPAVAAWQIDNEFGCHDSTRCYCEHCQRAFSAWLKKKYHTIGNLNRTFGTVFWSQEYDSFDDVILPAYTSCEGEYGKRQAHNPSLELDYCRFASDTWVNYQNMQAAIIRRYSKSPVTHNFMGHFSAIDYYKLGKELDIVSWDNYIDNQWNHFSYEETSMAHELMRGIKNKSFWIMEQQSGPCGWDTFGQTPRPGQLRLWTYQALAHGCEGILYFRFQAAPFGMEQYWYGVLDHDGIPRRRYYELQKTGEELTRLSPLFCGSSPVTDVLIVKSYDHVWSHEIKRHCKDFDYREMLYTYYKTNLHLGTNPAVGSEDIISSDYKIVYLPAFVILTQSLKEKLEQYVAAGGCLVITCLSGIKDESNNMITSVKPGGFRKLAGITVEEFDTGGNVTLSGIEGTSSIWRDILKTESAEIVAEYENEYYKGSPAITMNSYGKGKVWYVGCDLDEKGMYCLVREINRSAGISVLTPPEGTEIIRRRTDSLTYTILLNYTDIEKKLPMTGKSLLTGDTFTGSLKPYEIEILET